MSAAVQTITASLDTVEPFLGKLVAIVLTGRVTPESLFGKVLSAGLGGFVIDGESFSWPTSVKYHELADIHLDARCAIKDAPISKHLATCTCERCQ